MKYVNTSGTRSSRAVVSFSSPLSRGTSMLRTSSVIATAKTPSLKPPIRSSSRCADSASWLSTAPSTGAALRRRPGRPSPAGWPTAGSSADQLPSTLSRDAAKPSRNDLETQEETDVRQDRAPHRPAWHPRAEQRPLDHRRPPRSDPHAGPLHVREDAELQPGAGPGARSEE